MSPAAAAATGSAGAFELLASPDGQLAARGPLTFATASAARELGLRALAAASRPDLQVDCAGITAADSAGLAVLLDWLAHGRRTGRSLRYTHLPAGLVALAGISEAEGLLERGV